MDQPPQNILAENNSYIGNRLLNSKLPEVGIASYIGLLIGFTTLFGALTKIEVTS